MFEGLLFAQSPEFHIIDREAGLPHRSVYSIVQHSSGYLLVGTAIGLYKYDGLSFSVIPFSKTTSTRHAQVFGLSTVHDSSLLFWNNSGKLFRFAGDSIYEFSFTNLEESYHIRNFYIQREGDSLGYFTCRKLLLEVNLNSGAVLRSLPNDQKFSCFGGDEEGNLYAANRHGVTIYPKNEQGASFCPMPKWKTEEIDPLFNMRKSGQLGLTARKNGHYLDIIWNPDEGLSLVPIYLSPTISSIYAHYEDEPGRLWLTTEDGVIGIGEKNRGRRYLQGKQVRTIWKDREQNFWFGVFPEGIYQTPSLDITVYSVEKGGLPHNIVLDLEEGTEGRVILGLTHSMMGTWAKGGITCRKIGSEGNQEVIFQKDAAGQLFVNEKNKGIQAIDGAGLTSGPFIQARGIEIQPFTEEEWVMGTYSRVVTVKQENGLWKDDKKLVDGRWYCGKSDENQEYFWFSIDTVIYAYGRKTQSVDTFYVYDWGLKGSVMDFAFSGDTVWFAIYGTGVFGMVEGELVAEFTEENGLKGFGFNVLQYDNGELWAGSTRGIHQILTESGEIRNYNTQDGLSGNDITSMLVLEDTLWIGTTDGLTLLPKSSLRPDEAPPPIFITGLAVWEKDTLLVDSLLLNHNQNNLKIEFQGLNYKSRGKFVYKYRLLGLDSNWVETASSSNFARYPQLLPGEYVFEVITCTPNGTISEEPARVFIEIQSPYWQKWWFWGLIAGAVVALVWIGVMLYIRSIKQKNQIRERLIRSQLTALRTQMNPHFIFNALNSIQVFIAKSDILSANYYLNQFSVLMRLVLDMTTQTYITLAQELQALDHYLCLEKLRFEEDFTFDIKVDNHLIPAMIHLPAMLIQPYVENAIKHGLLHKEGEKKLWVQIGEGNPGQLLCVVRDNGVGRKEAGRINERKRNRHRSQGQTLTAQRLELLAESLAASVNVEIEDLLDSSGIPLGTQVSIRIPIVHKKTTTP